MSSKTTTATTPQNDNSLGSSILMFVLMMILRPQGLIGRSDGRWRLPKLPLLTGRRRGGEQVG